MNVYRKWPFTREVIYVDKKIDILLHGNIVLYVSLYMRLVLALRSFFQVMYDNDKVCAFDV